VTATRHRPVSRPPRDPAAEPWSGPWRRFDIVKEFVIATVVVALLTVLLAAVFSSPDEKPITLQAWAKADSNDFVATAVAELNGQSGTATYGAPYNNAPDSGQKLGPLPLQRWGGVRVPVDTADDFVLGPLRAVPNDPALTTALTTYSGAPADQQNTWASAYADALSTAPDGDPAKVATGDYGPVPALTSGLLNLAVSGGLDGALTSERGQFYASDYTKPLLFLADGSYLEDQARGQHLAGDQWGMMNETGNYPGQAWLWLYTFWYQIKPFSTSDNADALVWGLMALLTLLLLLLPFIPGLRSIPRLIPLHRVIWRDYYRRQNRT
jgi:hypothetical protein